MKKMCLPGIGMENFIRIMVCGVMLYACAATAESTIAFSAQEKQLPARRAIFGVNQLIYADGHGIMNDACDALNPDVLGLIKDAKIGSQRYPGGCGGTHHFNWKKTIGPISERSCKFGLMEFLKNCEETRSVPILSLSAFRGTPQEAAELVQFLNLPETSSNPWAQKRAKLGHPEPFSVKFFEYGNESYHGNCQEKGSPEISPQKYAADYLAFRTAMKAVDPDVELGLTIYNPTGLSDPYAYWNDTLFSIVRNRFDFINAHLYIPEPGSKAFDAGENLMFAQVDSRFHASLEFIVRMAANYQVHNVKIALTEFNTNRKDYKTLESALLNSEIVRLCLYHREFFCAQYWQFINEGWGMVGGKHPPYVLHPNYLMFKLYGDYLHQDLLVPNISDSEKETREAIPAAGAKPGVPDVKSLDSSGWDIAVPGRLKEELTHSVDPENNTLTVNFQSDTPVNYYFASQSVPASSRFGYVLSGEIKVDGMEKAAGAQLDLLDSRGWGYCHVASETVPVKNSQWTAVSATYLPLSDTHSLTVRARRVQSGGAGSMSFRNLKLTAFLPENPRRRSKLEATISTENDKTYGFVILNKTDQPQAIFIPFAQPSEGTGETLSGPSPDAVVPKAAIMPIRLQKSGDGYRTVLSPFSLTGIRIEVK